MRRLESTVGDLRGRWEFSHLIWPGVIVTIVVGKGHLDWVVASFHWGAWYSICFRDSHRGSPGCGGCIAGCYRGRWYSIGLIHLFVGFILETMK